jgi:thymidylate synthase (FAD)
LRYLIRHKHNTPVEMVELVFHIKLPIFIMRQHVRHRTASINEYSARYSEMSDEFYTPYHEDINLQSTTNKQGREEDPDLIEFETRNDVQRIMGESYSHSFKAYKELLDLGLARELARTVLPVANYTECFWKVNLHNFFHYCKLRRDPHAQKEIREFADAMFRLVEEHFPMACEAFNDYVFEAVTFSRMEMNLLSAWLEARQDFTTFIANAGGIEKVQEHYGLSKREFDEFCKKF